MKATSFLTGLYGLFVFLNGLMGTLHTDNPIAFLEMIGGVAAFICAFLMIIEKKLPYYLTMVVTGLLFIYYAYIFATTTQFFGGVLGAASVFIFIFQLMKVTRMGEPD